MQLTDHIFERSGAYLLALSSQMFTKGSSNTVTGKVAPEAVNVDQSIPIGKQQVREYEKLVNRLKYLAGNLMPQILSC